MKKVVLFLFFVYSNIVVSSQNLIPNGSFEDFSSCPTNLSQINLAYPWFQPCTTWSSSDYYNACDLTNYVSVPIQGGGNYQNARTGNAFAGIILLLFPNSNNCEYIEIELADTLIPNRIYCVSFFINAMNSIKWAIDGCGTYFSKDSVLSPTLTLLSYVPQVENAAGNFLEDSLNWIKISGSFTAIGGEKYLTIGNFKDTGSLGIDTVNYNNGNSYYFIDDVSVYECDAPVYIAEAGSTQTICINKSDSVQIGSMPQNDYIYWWQPALGLSNDSIANPFVNPTVTTTYYLHQKDFKFDETIDSVTVIVKSCEDTIKDDIFIPNIFSPNGDLNNDVFYVLSHTIAEMTFCIYNRWGEKVFESREINKGWDGTYKNEKCNTSVFVYYLEATLVDGRKVERQGNVMLVR